MVEEGELTITRQDDPRHGQPVAYRDIAILLRGLTDVQKYEEAFARRGVPCFVVGGGRGYYARHEIRDLLNVLTVLDTPLDDVAVARRAPFAYCRRGHRYPVPPRAAGETDRTGGRSSP